MRKTTPCTMIIAKAVPISASPALAMDASEVKPNASCRRSATVFRTSARQFEADIRKEASVNAARG